MIFRHMSGAGNTFLVANGANSTDLLTPHNVRSIIAEHPRADGKSIEGVLVLSALGPTSFAVDYYNPDGTHGMMCGNGARCAVRFAVDNGVDPNGTISFTLNNAPYQAVYNQTGSIQIFFPPPLHEHVYLPGELDTVDVPIPYVDVNSDHVVIEGPLDANRPIVGILRHHKMFPRGANVNMVEQNVDGSFTIATFERGVEAITGACGTGALSAALVLWRQGRASHQVTLVPPSGRKLGVTIHHNESTVTGLTLEGDAQYDDV